MLCLRNFKQYTPVVYTHGAGIYFQDQDGRDWYVYRERFQPDTLKVLFDEQFDNRIVSAGVDHSLMVPDNLSIAELPLESVPEHFQPDSNWSYRDGAIIQTLAAKKEAVREIRNFLLYSTDVMMTPDYTVHDELLSSEQRQELIAWRLALKRFPTEPGFPNIPFVPTPPWIMRLAVHHGFKPYTLKTIAHFCAVD